uniref:GRAM domain containing 2A n=1 Tax=Amazona collaria TaxID=241587 RepID=A0A8B9IXA1_9PSIT
MHEKAAPLKSPEPMHGREKLETSHKQRSLDSLDGSLRLNEALKDEDIKKCHREVAASKYNSQYHKLFKDIPTEESVLKVCSCALQRDILIQGRLYISPNWLCFYANLFGKDIKVVIPVVSVQLIKKHKTARLLPNGLAITTNASRKYIFVSLISRDSVYDVLRRVCTHLQVSSKKSLSLKELTEEPDAVSLEVIVPEGKWRKVSPASLSLSLPDTDYQCIHRTSVSSLSTKESSFTSEEPLVSASASWLCPPRTWRSASSAWSSSSARSTGTTSPVGTGGDRCPQHWLRTDAGTVSAHVRIPVLSPPGCGHCTGPGFPSAGNMGPSIFSLPAGTCSWWDLLASSWPPVPTPCPTGNLFLPRDAAVL